MKNACDQTALHVALIALKLVVAEQLVGYGADINAVDKHGDTPLHYAFVVKMAAPSKDTPQLLKVHVYNACCWSNMLHMFHYISPRCKINSNHKPSFHQILKQPAESFGHVL